jgi:magnesium chelatase family protein
MKAREAQVERFAEQEGMHCNAQMHSKQLRSVCQITKEGSAMLKDAMDKLNLSARAYDRILKVSRTIADLEGAESIENHHLAEAIQYRSLDREGWMG